MNDKSPIQYDIHLGKKKTVAAYVRLETYHGSFNHWRITGDQVTKKPGESIKQAKARARAKLASMLAKWVKQEIWGITEA